MAGEGGEREGRPGRTVERPATAADARVRARAAMWVGAGGDARGQAGGGRTGAEAAMRAGGGRTGAEAAAREEDGGRTGEERRRGEEEEARRFFNLAPPDQVDSGIN